MHGRGIRGGIAGDRGIGPVGAQSIRFVTRDRSGNPKIETGIDVFGQVDSSSQFAVFDDFG